MAYSIGEDENENAGMKPRQNNAVSASFLIEQIRILLKHDLQSEIEPLKELLEEILERMPEKKKKAKKQNGLVSI